MARGTVVVNAAHCKGCALCVHACPQHVLALTDEYNARGYRTVALDESAGACTGCGLCALVCPDVIFTVYREPARARAA